MRRKLLYIYFILISVVIVAQQKEYVLIDAVTQTKTKVKDSLSAVKFLDSLANNSYFFTDLTKVEQKGNTIEIFYNKGKNFNQGYISVNEAVAKKLKTEKEFYAKDIDSVKKELNKAFIDDGYVFNRIKSTYIGMKNNQPLIALEVHKNDQRKINGFVLKGYEKVPRRFLKNLNKEFNGKTYDEKTLLEINKNFQSHPFVTLDRPPQTLFTKDSTQIYLFTQKKKTNTFDGVIGFGNDKSEKFTLNGTLNVNFRNMFNGFEAVNIYWQRNPDKGQTFDLQTDVPYLLKSNVGINLKVNIFRQDSTFANVKLIPAFYYHINNRTKIGVRGTFETSSILDSLYVQGKDFSKKGIGLWYDMTEPSDIPLFLYRTKIRAEVDYLSTHYTLDGINAKQTQYLVYGEHNFHLGGNHYINLKGEAAMMDSKNPFSTNELFRFGGWNSMRGFNENSLLADFYYYGNAEYRYLIGQQAFFDFFAQYGSLNNKLLGVKPKLYSVGLGFNFFIPIGLMSFQISNGNEFGNPFKFNDLKIHWGILSRF